MVSKSRVPMQVSPAFENRIKKLQKEIMHKDGKKVSMRELTDKMAKATNFEDFERSILNIANPDITINFDRRKK